MALVPALGPAKNCVQVSEWRPGGPDLSDTGDPPLLAAAHTAGTWPGHLTVSADTQFASRDHNGSHPSLITVTGPARARRHADSRCLSITFERSLWATSRSRAWDRPLPKILQQQQ